MTTSPVHVELIGLSKRFGTTQAVSSVDLSIGRGTIHAIVGENGAGKSTLGKLIAGLHIPDSGTIRVDGAAATFRTPRQALDVGITAIAQELSLVPARSVVENVFLGLEATRGRFFMSRAATLRNFEALVDETGIELDGNALVETLSVADQQKVEILRAAARRARLVVMDEPSARLSSSEREHLHGVIRGMQNQGTTVVFISHFLDEVLTLADQITIMRDGQLVRTSAASDETGSSLVEAMTGRELAEHFPPKTPPTDSGESVLRVRGLKFLDSPGVDLDVRAGEIVGIAGLVGAGRSDLVHAIYGAQSSAGGFVEISGTRLGGTHPATAIRHGVGLIPESRKDQGLLLEGSRNENISLPHLAALRRGALVKRSAERAVAEAAAQAAEVKGANGDTAMRLLSGGNQQKCLFARWMVPGLKLLIADEPTRGVDVGSKRAIYDLISTAAAEGLAVLIVSSELEELIGLCHRVLVMRDREFVAEFAHPNLDETAILRHAFGEVAEASV